MAEDVSTTDLSDPRNHPKLSFDPSPPLPTRWTPRTTVLPTAAGRRKFSFPAALHANLLGLNKDTGNGTLGGAGGIHEPGKLSVAEISRRRFSNVTEATTGIRKLSHSIIGSWRLPTGVGVGVGGGGPTAVQTEEVVQQGRVLCGQYIRNRLKRSGFYSRKLGLYRLRSMIGMSSAAVVREVYPALLATGHELERLHPKLYTNVSRQASRTAAGGLLVSDKAAAALLAAIGHQLFTAATALTVDKSLSSAGSSAGVTWGKVVSMFAVAGGLAVDCVCQGRPEFLHGVMEGVAEVLEDDIGEWVATNGGWISLNNYCRFPEEDVTYREYATIIIIGFAVLLMVYFVIRLFFKIGIF